MSSVPPSDSRQNPGPGPSLAKGELRRAARVRRAAIVAALSAEQRLSGAKALTDAVMPLVRALTDDRDEGAALRVAAYESLPTEPPTGLLIEALLAAGHEVIVPVTLADWSLQWRHAEAGAVGDASTVTRLKPSNGPEVILDDPPGIEPAEQWIGLDALSGVDLVLTPGLSVDLLGTRLGQGGGCYDRALAHRNPAAPAFTLLHDGELSDRALPHDDHDVRVNGVITTTGQVLRAPRNPSDAG